MTLMRLASVTTNVRGYAYESSGVAMIFVLGRDIVGNADNEIS